MRLVLSTRNSHKVREFAGLLDGFDLVPLPDEDRWSDELGEPDVEEETLEEGYAPWEVRVDCRSHHEAREGSYRFLTTGDPAAFRTMGARFLQLPIAEVERVSLDELRAAAA